MTEAWTILRVLDWTRSLFEQRGLDSPRLDAEVLIADALGLSRIMLYARFDQPLAREELDRVRARVKRRANGEPAAYIRGEREFWSLALEVSPAVLIPRPDTERLVEVVVERLAGRPDPLAIVDVGTGSGAIALALKKERPGATVRAVDVSEAALEVARRNAAKHGLEVEFHAGSLLAPVSGPFDAIVANLPYIPSDEVPTLIRDVRDFEPHLALDGGPDGLVLIRRLIAEAPGKLRAGGLLALEATGAQLGVLERALVAAGYRDVGVARDLAGAERVVSGFFGG